MAPWKQYVDFGDRNLIVEFMPIGDSMINGITELHQVTVDNVHRGMIKIIDDGWKVAEIDFPLAQKEIDIIGEEIQKHYS